MDFINHTDVLERIAANDVPALHVGGRLLAAAVEGPAVVSLITNVLDQVVLENIVIATADLVGAGRGVILALATSRSVVIADSFVATTQERVMRRVSNVVVLK